MKIIKSRLSTGRKLTHLWVSAVLLCISATVPGLAQNIVPGTTIALHSPDGHIQLEFYQRSDSQNKKTLWYQVSYDQQPIIAESALDLELDNSLSEKAMALKVDTHAHWFENLSVKTISRSSHDTTWIPAYGEKASIRDHYNAATVELIKDDNDIYPMNIEFRVYDEGIAFRFYFPENTKGTYYNVTAENTEFSLLPGAHAWFANWAQAPYYELGLKDWPGESERPLTIRTANGFYISLAEAGLVDYSRTKFRLSDTKPNTIVTSMAGGAQLISPFGTPWRTILIAKSATGLIERDHLIQNLNAPAAISDQSWIRPGKIMRVMTQTTAAAKANIDFAAKQHLQYILFDWKWYGPAFSFGSDATKVAIPDFDLPAIISYAKSKGLGVWLYVNQQALLAQSDSLFRVYHQWGISGVKFGFVQVGSHRWTTWIEKAIQQAAQNHIMVNIHDDWRPTGEQRTWPNLMTAEGIRGNEEMPDATHNTILPFTRFLAGGADYTICYFDKRIKTTHAHQLALAAIFYSPIQTLFWYDQPEQYHQEPELDFWQHIPTVWDETRALDGEPGQFVVTARRKGAEWFLGAITNDDARDIRIPLSFLESGKQYNAYIYSDDPAVQTVTHVAIKKMTVNGKLILSPHLMPSGGTAIRFEPVN